MRKLAQKILCRLGGLDFVLATDEPRIATVTAAQFGPYGDQAARYLLQLRGLPPEAFPARAERLFCARVAGGWQLQLGSELMLRVGQDAAEATLAMSPDFFPPGSVQNAVRLCLALRHAELGGVMLHAAGGVDHGEAFVFVGKSGAGKSTLSRTFAEQAFLGDEMMCIDAQGVVHRSPFTGERLPQALALSAPLRAVGVLAHSPRFAVRPGRLVDLLPHVFSPSTERALSLRLIDNLTRLARPVLHLDLPRPAPPLSVLSDRMRGGETSHRRF